MKRLLLAVMILFNCEVLAFAVGATEDAVVRIGNCSGVCVDQAGIILTAKHCDLPERTTVVFPQRRPVSAVRIYVGGEAEDVVAFDAEGEGWPSATVASVVPEAGDPVRSAGYPVRDAQGQRFRERALHWASGRLTGGGRMMFKRNNIPMGQFNGNNVDFATGPGWSGGPLFNRRGEVVGLLSAGDAHGSIYISWGAVRRAIDAAEVRQATARPHLLIFGYEECRYCRVVKQDMAAGRFDRYDYEYVDIVADADGRQRYDRLVAAIEKANGETPPEGFPAFHLAGRASLHVGYPPGASGLSRLRSWALETLRLPVTLVDAITGGGKQGISPPPDVDVGGNVSPLPDDEAVAGVGAAPSPEHPPDLPERKYRSPLGALLAGLTLFAARWAVEKFQVLS